MLLLLLPLCSADINGVAKGLKGLNDYHTVLKIDAYVYDTMDFKLSIFPKGVEKAWYDKTGDCTEIAMLRKYMYEVNGIRGRYAHGFAGLIPHDWVEVYLDNEWQTSEIVYFTGLKKVGDGLWIGG